ncbi:MAG: O-antigen translocase [Chitinophagaceae bacterium]|nr:O-antigen translocase [Chitinophagaceae bacterium]
MNLIKTSFYTSISTAITFLSGFILIKVIAIKIGPAGVAQLGQFQNTTALFTLAGTASITVGVTKYLAQFKEDVYKRQQVITTAITTVIISSLFTGIIVIILSRFLSIKAFHSPDYWKVYVLFGSFLILISLNLLSSSILNGIKEIKKLTIVNTSGALLGIIFTVSFANILGVTGVLIAANFTALTLFVINLIVFQRIHGLSIYPSLKHFNKPILLLLLSYTLMNVVSGALSPVSQLFVRDYIIKHLSITQAGYWQAMTRISDYYLLFITTILGVYYLPTLSSLKENHEIKKEIIRGYKIVLPIVGCLAIGMFLCRAIIIKLVFTDSFTPMKELFLFQLLGDFFKIGSWLLAYLMLAKAMIKTFIITEVVFTISLIIFTRLFLNNFGLIGSSYAFALNYLLYWIMMIMVMRKYLF